MMGINGQTPEICRMSIDVACEFVGGKPTELSYAKCDAPTFCPNLKKTFEIKQCNVDADCPYYAWDPGNKICCSSVLEELSEICNDMTITTEESLKVSSPQHAAEWILRSSCVILLSRMPAC